MRHLFHLAATIAMMGLCCDTAPTSAHDMPISNMKIVAAEEAMHVELVLNSAELNFFSEIDRDKNGFLDSAELEEQGDQISKLIADCFSFQVDGQPVAAAVIGIVPNIGSHHLTVRAHYPVDARAVSVHLESRLLAIMRRSHVIEVVFQRPNRMDSARLNAHDQEVLFDYENAERLPEKPTVLPASGENPSREYRILFGLAALLGGFFFFRGKHR